MEVSRLPMVRMRSALILLLALATPAAAQTDEYGAWMARPQAEWPQLALVNHVEYTDASFPLGGCAFLIDTGDVVVAATAKHLLTHFRSRTMTTVTFEGTLKSWTMSPKSRPEDAVVVERLINESADEDVFDVPPERDWLLFTISERSPNVQPLRLRQTPLEPGEPVYIVGWRFSDPEGPQVVYPGRVVRVEDGSPLIETESLSDIRSQGLGGAPVLDAGGFVIGLMSQKAGTMERLAPVDYPLSLLDKKKKGRGPR